MGNGYQTFFANIKHRLKRKIPIKIRSNLWKTVKSESCSVLKSQFCSQTTRHGNFPF